MTNATTKSDGETADAAPSSRKRVRWRRVIAIYIVGGLCCTGIYVAGQEYVARSATPARIPVRSKITTDALHVNFGPVRPGQVLRHEFSIENQGPNDLVLTRRDTGTNGKQSEPIVIPSGKSRKIPIEVRAGRRPGFMQELIDFSTNSPDRPRIRFTVIATVRADQPRHGRKSQMP